MNKLNSDKIIFFICIFLALTAIGMYINTRQKVDNLNVIDNDCLDNSRIIKISLSGEVKNSGEYSVPVGTLLHDVIYEAGGVTKNADLTNMNLKQYMENSCTVVIPKKQKDISVKANRSFSYTSENRCNINSANTDALSALDGIGDALAERIVRYRTENGKFKSIDEIKRIKGINEKNFNVIKEFITVGGE